MIEVKFENPPGHELTTRQFAPGQPLRVGCYCENNLSPGIPEPFLRVTFEMYGDGFASYYTDTMTNFFGNAWVDWQLPNVVTTATVRITAYDLNGVSPIRQSETITIPIGIGKTAPPVIPPGNESSYMWAILLGLVAVGSAFAYSKGKS